MVYAVWCVRRDYADNYPEIIREISHAFQQSMEMSAKNIDAIAEEAARWDIFSKHFLKKYFITLKFEFGAVYQQGFCTYLKKANRLGAIDGVLELAFF